MEEKVFEKIDTDYVDFREGMQALDSLDVYDYAYKIYAIEEIYGVLTESYEFTKLQAEAILNCKENIFEKIYTEWIDRATSQHDAFCSVIESVIESMS
ncbi:MAG: DUF3848 domain-containing protein [Clostridia bacterium]|nr:DUF3848 domain-containing protein [Clostridia bacterium]